MMSVGELIQLLVQARGSAPRRLVDEALERMHEDGELECVPPLRGNSKIEYRGLVGDQDSHAHDS